MTIGRLFNRQVAVELGRPGSAGIRLEGLRVGFRVEHKAERSPSVASIEVYNPAPTTVGLLDDPATVVRLYVGYAPLPRLVFVGRQVRSGVSLSTQGADRVLRIDASDGGRGFTRTLISVSFAKGTTFGRVLSEVIAKSGWARGAITIDTNAQLPYGVVLVGRPSEIMDRIASGLAAPGADWFVRDEALYVVTRGESTPEVAPLISSRTGNLIGTPTPTGEGLKVRALIDATMRPGRKVAIQSARISGLFVVRDALFFGDSGFASPYWMDLTARPLGAP